MRRFVLFLATTLAITANVEAQSSLKFDDTVFDFGQVLLSDGAVECSFTATNVSSSEVTVQSVISSCGCTSVKWDRNPIKPGQKTTISAKYSNDEGPYPFDKTLTVRITGEKRPVLLHIRGVSQEVMRSDKEMFPVVFCDGFAMATRKLKSGNIEVGMSKGDQVKIANLLDREIKIGFTNVSDGLSLEVSPNPVPAKSHAILRFTIYAKEGKWGNNSYTATPVVNGKTAGSSISVNAFTTENFSNLTKEEKAKGSHPLFEESTFSFGHRKKGEKITASFICTNKGQSELIFHTADADCKGTVVGSLPKIKKDAKGRIDVSCNTESLPKGEALVIITLTTNSPARPVVNLFLAGIIDD